MFLFWLLIMTTSFYIYLPSNAQGVNNKTSSFTVQLPKKLDFHSNWMVGLTNIIYPYSWPNLGTDSKQYIETDWINGQKTRVYIPTTTYSSVEKLLNGLKNNLKNQKSCVVKRSKRHIPNVSFEKNEFVEILKEKIENEKKRLLDIGKEKNSLASNFSGDVEQLKNDNKILEREKDIILFCLEHLERRLTEETDQVIDFFNNKIKDEKKLRTENLLKIKNAYKLDLEKNRQEFENKKNQIKLLTDQNIKKASEDALKELELNVKECEERIQDIENSLKIPNIKEKIHEEVKTRFRNSVSEIENFILDRFNKEQENFVKILDIKKDNATILFEDRIRQRVNAEYDIINRLTAEKKAKEHLLTESRDAQNKTILKKEINSLITERVTSELAKDYLMLKLQGMSNDKAKNILFNRILADKQTNFNLMTRNLNNLEPYLEERKKAYEEGKSKLILITDKKIKDAQEEVTKGMAEEIAITEEQIANFKRTRDKIPVEELVKNKALERGEHIFKEIEEEFKKEPNIEKNIINDILIEREKEKEIQREEEKKETHRLEKMEIETKENEQLKMIETEKENKRQEKLKNIEQQEECEFSDEISLDKILNFSYDLINERFHMSIDKNYLESVKLSEQLAYILGFEDRFFTNTHHFSTYSPDLRGGLHTLYIYSPGLVENSIIGDKAAPLLRIAKVKGKNGDIVEDTFITPQYYKILEKTITEIHIDICTSTGRKVPFSYGDCILTLNFRKSLLF